MLRLEGIQLAPGARSFSHEFHPGTISVVLGRNHAGKTRLCRMLAGLEPCAPGSLRLYGEDISELSPGRRPVALVYQSFVNYPNLTVAENIASPLRAQRVSRDVRRARVRELARQLHIGELMDRYPDQLSGGQQQRLAIARALAKQARVLVLDEPLVNLDFKLREGFAGELRGMLRNEALIVVYTTSDSRDAFNLGDSVLLLRDHSLLQSGPPLEVYQTPSSSAAAGLMSDPGINCWCSGEVLYGVRPEHLHVRSASSADVSFDVELLGVETNGSETYLRCCFEGRHWIARLEGLFEPPAARQAAERITLFARADAVLAFPGERHVG